MFVPMLNLSFCYLFILLIQTITSEPACVYNVGDGQTLDIRPLGNANGKQPKYDQIPNTSPGGNSLSWNGCFTYSKSGGGDCINAAACSINKNTGISTLIAKQNDVLFEHNEAVNLLVYEYSTTHLTVFLVCQDADEDIVTASQEDANTYRINVRSRCCCPGKCHYSSGSIGVGAILVIILVVVLFVYIIGGILFLKFARGATGQELIPNRVMWLNLLSCAIDGVRYCIQVIRYKTFNVNYDKV